jgi:ankyrin repeat protein
MGSTFVRSSCLALALATLIGSGRATHAAGSLFDAIRSGSAPAIAAAIAAGADVNGRDETGATPLMYAAIYADAAAVEQLIDKGARVNDLNTFGATALMWAAPQPAIVDVLLRKGADVNALASNGFTPLVVAARYGSVESVRRLLAAGADTRAQATRVLVLSGAYQSTNPDVIGALRDEHVVVTSKEDIAGPALIRARNDIRMLNRLLDAGVDPKEEVPLITLSLPTFFVAAREGQLDAIKAFVAAGFDPTATSARGWTALMLAAGGDTPNHEVLQFLLDAGTDINAKDDDGRTALDWALTRGETETVAFLRKKGAKTNAAAVSAPSAIAAPLPAHEAVKRAVARIQPVGPAFSDRMKCNSCHNQNIPGMAAAIAKARGVPVDATLLPHSMKVTEQNWRNRREPVLLGDTAGGGFQANVLYGLLEMAESRVPATLVTDAMVLGLASRQMPDGSFLVGAEIRPPLNGTEMTLTSLAIRALTTYAPAGRRDEMQRQAVRALDFVRNAAARDTQDHAFKLLAMVWGKANADEVSRQRDALLALQRPDGGWAQLPTMSSDAYATGQALYALHAANVAAGEPAFKRGTEYLLRTQLEDGTWFVRTRAFGFQPYFETGFPHGRSQFISTVATSWASIALSYTLSPSALSQ